MMRKWSLLSAACLLLSAVTVARAAAADFSVAAAESAITYHLVHKFHKVDGTSQKIEGRARLLSDGKVQVMVRAAVRSFDSGNVNRDAHMQEVMDAAKYPEVTLKAAADGLSIPAQFPTTMSTTFKAQLSFHGVQKLLTLPVTLTWKSDHKVQATTSFTISLDEYKVERPSLMFVKVEDPLKIDVKVTFSR